MANKTLMGIENEFKLMRRGIAQDSQSTAYFRQIVEQFPIPFYQKSPSCVRLATGGSFYVDGNEPEVTTAPFQLEPGAAIGLASNLALNINCVLEGLRKVNEQEKRGMILPGSLYLQGYSAHYSFTFPHLSQRTPEVASLLAQTVNPALQLLLENRKSGGLMFRNRENGRLEICGDYIPAVDDAIAAVAFQSAMLYKIDRWLAEGAEIDDIQHKLRYLLPSAPEPVRSRHGYKLRTPEVIHHGRQAKVEVIDKHKPGLGVRFLLKCGTAVRPISAQALLEHFYELCEDAGREVLSQDEGKILLDAVEGKRRLPIDSIGYPEGYTKVKPQSIDPEKAISPLTKALGNAVKARQVDGVHLKPTYLGWDAVGYDCSQNGDSSSQPLWVPLDGLVSFERLVAEHPELLAPMLQKTLTAVQVEALRVLGIEDPAAFLTPRPCTEFSNRLFYLNEGPSEIPQEIGRDYGEGISRVLEIYRDFSNNYLEVPEFLNDYSFYNIEITPIVSQDSPISVKNCNKSTGIEYKGLESILSVLEDKDQLGVKKNYKNRTRREKRDGMRGNIRLEEIIAESILEK